MPSAFPLPPSTPLAQAAPRCLSCDYVLEGLPNPRCPECGRAFDFANPATYNTRPPFVRWKYWFPGLLLALGGGLSLYAFVWAVSGFGLATTLVVPFSAGALLGYSVRLQKPFWLILLSIILLGGLLIGLLSFSIVGVFCGMVLGGLAVGPLLIGALVGWGLRSGLKRSRFDQRWHLPTLLLILTPILWGAIEGSVWAPAPVETVRTSIVIAAPLGRAWNSLMFYEQVHGTPPVLFRLGMPRPLSTTGSADHVGDKEVCVYDKGRLVKQITAREPNRQLSFLVVEQGFERHAITLEGGGFTFEPLGPVHTRVTLTTRYTPLMRPRWCWRPFEQWTARALHEHVLAGMKRAAEGVRDTVAADSSNWSLSSPAGAGQ